MISPRWRKVLKDLGSNKVRTLLVILTIGVGVFAVGFNSNAFILIKSDMDADYQSANPHVATIYTEPFNDDLLHVLNQVPGVGQVEGRGSAGGSIHTPDGRKIPIGVTALPPLEQMQIDLIRPHDPPVLPPLGKHEIYLERTTLAAYPFQVGEMIDVELADGAHRSLRVAAIVHSVTSFPYVFNQQAVAYSDLDTIAWLGGSSSFDQVLLTVQENKLDEAHVNAVAGAVSEKIKDSGRQVFFTLVFRPGRHFAWDITQSLGVMMGFLGALSVLLSAFLVINTINALLAQHVRQIGVMKSVGARTTQLVVMYLVLVVSFGLISLLFAIPLATLAADFTGHGIAQYLNYQPGPLRVFPISIVMQVAVALLVPVGTALLPVWKGTHITIREAISSYGLSGRFGTGLVDRLVERVRGLPRPLLISLRNTFRRKARLALTLTSLILAGGIFIAVFNLRAAMSVAITETLGYLLSDVNVGFNQAYPIQRLQSIARSHPEVELAEGWSGANGEVLNADQTTSTQVGVYAPPANSSLIDPTLTAGRWLLPEDENALVIGNHLLAARPELKVGDTITMSIDGREHDWRIVGVYRMAGNVVPPIVYANYEYLARITGQVNRIASLRIVTRQHDILSQQHVGQQLEAAYTQAGIQVGSIVYGANLIAANNAQIDILVYIMLVMAVLIALVGGLGLTSTMSMNVIERTREIGVMRAIGAANRSIMLIVLVEGMLIGVLSWILGALLSLPISTGLNNVVGVAFLQSPLNFTFSLDGFLVWLAMVLVISAVASYLPARSAARLTVREVLAYE